MMDFVFVNNVGSHLCDSFLGAGGKVWRRESKTAICPCVIRLEVKGHFLLPLATLTKVQAVNTDKPVRARDHLYHQGQLSIGQREEETENSMKQVSIRTLAFSTKHSCAKIQPDGAKVRYTPSGLSCLLLFWLIVTVNNSTKGYDRLKKQQDKCCLTPWASLEIQSEHSCLLFIAPLKSVTASCSPRGEN